MPRRLRARRQRIVAMRALLQRRNDQRLAGHHPFQHRMRRARPAPAQQPRSPPARSARRPARARPVAAPARARSGRDRARPRCPERECRASRVRRPARSRAGAKLGSWSRNPRATFGPAAATNLAALSRSKVCSDVRCSSMIVARAVSSVRKVQHAAGQRRCAGFPMSRRRWSRAAPAGTASATSTSPKSVAIGLSVDAWPPAASINSSLSD